MVLTLYWRKRFAKVFRIHHLALHICLMRPLQCKKKTQGFVMLVLTKSEKSIIDQLHHFLLFFARTMSVDITTVLKNIKGQHGIANLIFLLIL